MTNVYCLKIILCIILQMLNSELALNIDLESNIINSLYASTSNNDNEIEIVRYFWEDETNKLYFPQIYPKGTNKSIEPVTDESFLTERFDTEIFSGIDSINKELWSLPIMKRNDLYGRIISKNGDIFEEYEVNYDEVDLNSDNRPYLFTDYEIAYQSNSFVSIITKMTVCNSKGDILRNYLYVCNYSIVKDKYFPVRIIDDYDEEALFYDFDILTRLDKNNVIIKNYNGDILPKSDYYKMEDLFSSSKRMYFTQDSIGFLSTIDPSYNEKLGEYSLLKLRVEIPYKNLPEEYRKIILEGFFECLVSEDNPKYQVLKNLIALMDTYGLDRNKKE